MAAYVFGDNDVAAQRLHLVAELYETSTRDFVRQWVSPAARTVVDLGCALGYTTRLLAEALPSARTIGLDISVPFIEAAQRASGADRHITYLCHDVTQVPFPMAPVDVLFCRLLLTHMAEPLNVVAGWATQLRPGGILLMEEVEWIHTNCPVFNAYLDMQRALLQHQGNCLDIGPSLDTWPAPPRLQKRSSHVRSIPVPSAQAAQMFALNFQTWQHHAFVQAHFPATQIQHIEQGLQALAAEPRADIEIEWGMRQLAYVCTGA